MMVELSEPELLASPLGSQIATIERITLAGQAYLLVDFTLSEVTPQLITVLSRLAATSEAHEYFDRVGDLPGPLLRPLEPDFQPFVPLEMAEARRYKGKTNEIFTHVLLNAALFGGQFADQITRHLRILDPLAGGGTTLFLALAAGYDALGIEQERADIESTAVFVKQYLQGQRISYKELEERRRIGRRFQFEIGPKGQTRRLILAQGDSRQADEQLREVPGGARVHAIVGDLPYGIQHFGEIENLLRKAIPVWEQILLPGGTIALAWNATRINRSEMVAFLEEISDLKVRDDPPFNSFAHTVDRVIKKRDIIIATKS